MQKRNFHSTKLIRLFLLSIAPIALVTWYATASSFVSGCGSVQLGGDRITVDLGTGPRSMVTGDFNHDGRVDFATANFGSGQGQTDGSISVVLNNGSGGFVSPTSITSGINPRSIVTADFNKDGNADVAVLHYVNGSCCISTFATVFLSNAAGVFSAAGAPVPVGNDASSIAVGDFNKDTNPDLVAVSPTSGVILLLGNGSGAFSAPQLFGGVGSPQSVAVGDVNGDTKLDVIAGGTFGFNLSVLLGDGSGGFGAPTSV
ncbi:MAG TPA: VCBS repeat-containing protein, partial [Pyrinomonadaceae bacterium]|nr:VCBS repeat-containing protein [Pyrinomonadaceae bacterium]